MAETGGGVRSGNPFRAVFDTTTNAYVLVDRDLRVVEANEAFRRVADRNEAHLVGADLSEVFPDDPGHPETDFAGALATSVRRALATGERNVVTAFRYDTVAADGSFRPRYLTVTSSPVGDTDGAVAMVLNDVEDVTTQVEERRAAQAVAAANSALRDSMVAVQADLLDRAAQLQALNQRLRTASEHDRRVALALQDAMLTRLPSPDGLELAARYLTPVDHEQVGGDWYDAITLPSGVTSLMIGDVVGHDIAAAGLMGQLRSMLRALAWDRQQEPSLSIGRLDLAIADLAIPAMATLVTMSVDPPLPSGTGARRVRWSNAGHPPPVAVSDGAATLLQGTPGDLMVGVDPTSARHDHSLLLGVGTTLLLYTDGLVETRRQSIDDGQRRLLGAACAHAALPVTDMLDAVISDMVGGHPGDDVAVLAARISPA